MKTKRIFTILSFTLVALTLTFAISSCTRRVSSEVRLNSLVGSHANTKTSLMAFYDEEVLDNVEESKEPENEGNESITTNDISLNNQYIIIDKMERVFTLSIILDNEKDYHIFDFNLECTDEGAMVYLDDDFYPLENQKSINWKGATNKRFDIKLKLTESIEDVTINIKDIFFANRETAKSHFLADLNNKGTFNVYKVTEPVKITLIGRDVEKNLYKFKYEILDNRVKEFTLNGVKTFNGNDENKEFTCEDYIFDIEYEYNFTETLKSKYSTNVDLKLNSLSNDYWGVDTYTIYPQIFISFAYNDLANEDTIYNVKMCDRNTDKILVEVNSKSSKIEICDNSDFKYKVSFFYLIIEFDGFVICTKR